MENNRPGVGVTVLIFSNEKSNHVLMGKRLNKTGYGMYAFPGGHVEFGESFIETAIREVSEETGLVPKILSKIGENNYEFYKKSTDKRYEKNIIYKKTVYFFLMAVTGGDIKNHDHEFDKVLWMSLEKSKEKLTYNNEFSIVEKAFFAQKKD